MTDDVLVVHGGTPAARTRSASAAPRTSSPRRWWPRCSATTPSRLYDVPRIRDVEVVRGLLELHGVQGHRRRRRRRAASSTRPTSSAPAPTRSTCTPVRAGSRSCSAARCCTGSATRSSPTWAAATSAPRPIDFHLQALREFGAIVDKTPEGLHLTAPNGLHGTKFELPYPSVGATEQVLLTAVLRRGRHRAAQRGRRAGDHRPDLRAAEDGRDHQGAHRPGHRDRGRAAARRLHATGRSRTASRPPAGPRPRWPPAATSRCAAPGRPT